MRERQTDSMTEIDRDRTDRNRESETDGQRKIERERERDGHR